MPRLQILINLLVFHSLKILHKVIFLCALVQSASVVKLLLAWIIQSLISLAIRVLEARWSRLNFSLTDLRQHRSVLKNICFHKVWRNSVFGGWKNRWKTVQLKHRIIVQIKKKGNTKYRRYWGQEAWVNLHRNRSDWLCQNLKLWSHPCEALHVMFVFDSHSRLWTEVSV